MDHVPGAWPSSLASSRTPSQMSTRSDATIRPSERSETTVQTVSENEHHNGTNHPNIIVAPFPSMSTHSHVNNASDVPLQSTTTVPFAKSSNNNERNISNIYSETSTKVPTPVEKSPLDPTEEVDTTQEEPAATHEGTYLAPIVTHRSHTSNKSELERRRSHEEDIFRHLSRRRTSQGATRQVTQSDDDEQAEIERLLSRMFGRTRQETSEEEKTRHVGVVWKNLTVKGLGLGSALQPSTGVCFSDFLAQSVGYLRDSARTRIQ